MEPRFGRLYANAVLRPLAEQVVGVLRVHPGETACDLMCDGGTLGVALGAAIGERGRVVLVDTDAALLESASREVARDGCSVSTRLVVGGAIPLVDLSCDRVASLCTFGFWSGDSLLDVAARMQSAPGRAGVLTWDAAHLPLHEVALLDAVRGVLGAGSAFLAHCLAGPDPQQAARWEPLTLHDVVRFDGIESYWMAMVTERPVAEELAGETATTLGRIRAACQRALEPCTAADGTMRIPVSATLWCSAGSPRS
jgi:ubiE/COQ5 methyltransferase family